MSTEATITVAVSAIVGLLGVAATILAAYIQRKGNSTSDSSHEVPGRSDPAAQTNRVYGPVDGQLEHKPGGGIQWKVAGVSLRDAVIEAAFENATALPTPMSAAILFFRVNGRESYRLFIKPSGVWGYGCSTDGRYVAMVEDQRLSPDFSLTKCQIRVVLRGERGRFYLNGHFVADLDLALGVKPGDIAVAIDLQCEAPFSVCFTGFQIMT